MPNYYEILGLANGAGIADIKVAFRQLAKLYHPDVNPHGKEKFTAILKAYEVLSDPNLKYAYDYKLNSANHTTEKKANPRRDKHWKFDERELKRRQYYNEHIKKYEKKFHTVEKQEPKETSYNEFKYILFATPLAVALFLGIMALTSKSGIDKKKQSVEVETISQAGLVAGDSPYADYFGNQYYERREGASQIFLNESGSGAIVCLFSGKRFVRSFYMDKGLRAEVPQLPSDALLMQYITGNSFDQNAQVPGTNLRGAFTHDVHYFIDERTFRPSPANPVHLQSTAGGNIKEVSAKAFFKRYD